MTNWGGNLDHYAIDDEMLERFDEGAVAGYEGSDNGDGAKDAADMARGEAAWARFLASFSPFERGFIFGRQVRVSETGRY